MGVLITDNPIVLDNNWYPTTETDIKINDYSWTPISKTGAAGIVYFLEYAYGDKAGDVFKFLTSEILYSYTPATFTVIVNSRIGTETKALETAVIECELHYSYFNENNNEVFDTLEEKLTTSNGVLSINLNKYSSICLEYLVFNCYYNNERILTEIKNIPFGTKREMAQLALNASDIVASIQSTKLTFNTDGLTIKNGGLKIFGNDENNPVFYVNTNGDLSFTGELITSSGSLGGWKINEFGLYTEDSLTDEQIEAGIEANKIVGLYGGGNLYHPYDTTQSPIRMWAGQYDDFMTDEESNITTFKNYNFAVTHNGSLYANQAFITGKIIANDGYIENKFLIGSTNNGIIIYGGNEEKESYIGSTLYSSGALGYGWKLSQDGTAEFNNIIARGKIQSSVFEYNKISSVGGSLYIAPTIYVESASSLISLSTATVNTEENLNNTFIVQWTLPYANLQDLNGRDWKVNDEIKLDGDILTSQKRIELSNVDGILSEEINNDDGTTTITVSFSTSTYTTDDLVGQYFQPGAILILYGSEERRHGLYLTAAGANSPYMDVYDDSEDNTVKPAVRIGNLSGVNDANFPETTLSGYGLYSSNAYLRGQLMLPGAGITNQTTINYGEGETSSPIRIWAGIDNIGDDITSANFIVTANGYMYAKQGIFEGTVKASNSEFSGTIKAAGIVIEDGATGYNPKSQSDHFFVAYNDQPTSFNDYVLDIGSHGLSIWEGGLRAYSDYASGLEETTYINPIYGYSNSTAYNYTNPLPYFSLADDGNGEELNARIVAHKGHFLVVEENSDKYTTNSVIFNKGIQFSTGSYDNKTDIETSAYYNSAKIATISLKENILTINDDKGLTFSSKSTIYFSPNNDDLLESHSEKIFIRGQVKLVNDITDNAISLNKQIIKEVKDSENNSIGIDIIVS